MNAKELKAAKDEVIKCRRNGGTLKDCATMGGIDVSTLYRWREDAWFAMQLHQARTLYKMTLLMATRVRKPEWLLERQFPEEFGKNQTESEDAVKKYYTSDEDLAQRLVRLFNPTQNQVSLDSNHVK